jgi:radical SAM superfamily enzyme YgiQ (UPF0313 family)
MSINRSCKTGKKILLALLPFWTPLIPPMGVACLKSHLKRYDFEVTVRDANVEVVFKEIYHRYLDTLKKYVPEENHGNFYNIGIDVLQNHMMVHINYQEERQYLELVKKIIFQTFSFEVDSLHIKELNQILTDFYTHLGNYFIGLLEEEEPAVLGLSVYSGTLPASVFAFKLTREKKPHIMTVMGGGIFAEPLALGSPNLDFFLEKTKQYIDKIMIGEGELLFLKLLRGELPESQRVFNLKDINGEILDITSADIPDFSGFQLENYPYLASYTSRSCPFQCSFCSEAFQWGPYRKKSAKQISKELRILSQKHDNRLFLMSDSLLNPIITTLARELEKNPVPIYWDGYLRADKQVGNLEKAMLWRRGGFYRARFGVESGSPRILKLMGKRVTVAQTVDAVSCLAFAGIKTTTYWIIGYPGETEADFQMTLDLLEKLRDDIYEADCNPFAFFLSGQVNSEEWLKKNKCVPLYPEEAKDMLLVQTWIMDCYPPREEIFRRLNRFAEHCQKLNIPNPYTLRDIYEADERWKQLHKNAVPPLAKFMGLKGNNVEFLDENKNLKEIVLARNLPQPDDDWGF